jgi:hypothetical protein
MTSPKPQNDTPRRSSFPRFSPPLPNAKNNPKRQPHAYLDTGVANSQRKRKEKRRTTRAEKAQNRLRAKDHLCALLREIKEFERAESVERCNSAVTFLTCGEHSYAPMPNHVCEFRLCPYCARRRSRKIINKYLPAMVDFAKTYTPQHLVLTQTHKREKFTGSAKRVMKAFRKLIRGQFWDEHFAGGTWSVESTVDENGLYHTHLHLIVFRKKFCDVKQLRAEWLRVTGDSHVLRLEQMSDVESGLREVLKYTTKVDEHLTAEKLKEILEAKGMKMFGTFGKFRAFAKTFNATRSDNEPEDLEDDAGHLSENDLCPHCNQNLFELRMSAPNYVGFLKQLEMSRNAKLEQVRTQKKE